jgi:hypothetical protein
MIAWRRHWLAAGSAAAALVFAGSCAISAPLHTVAAPTHIEVRARPIVSFDNRDSSRTRFGALEFRGGLVLTSDHHAFGGISAIQMQPDGSHFIAVTDRGSWLRARILYRDGRPAGVADAELAPALGPDGAPLASRRWFDLESLAGHDGQFYVGIERVNKIVHFDLTKGRLTARGEPIPVPDDFKTFASNKSLECLAAPPAGMPLAGSLIAVTERSLDKDGNHRGFVFEGQRVLRFSVKRSGGFDVSDCAVLPPGDLLLLERSYSLLAGVAMRIRRISVRAIKEGVLADGNTLITADMGFQIDNMEGLGVHRAADGTRVLTLVSDDNFSPLQRTLLLQFAIVED